MHKLFMHCQSLSNLNLSNWNTSNVTVMNYMFSYCYKLKTVDLSMFDTHNVTDMSGLFYKSIALTNLDLRSFDTTNVINMNSMFEDCYCLNTIKTGEWNLLNVKNMQYMFHKCSSLKELDISGWIFSKDIFMDDILFAISWSCGIDIFNELDKKAQLMENTVNFNPVDYNDEEDIADQSIMSELLDIPKDTGELKNIIRRRIKENKFGNRSLCFPDLSDIDTSLITDMRSLFYSMLTDINIPVKLDLSNWDVSNVNNMSYMFLGGIKLVELDLSNWDLSNVTTFFGMF